MQKNNNLFPFSTPRLVRLASMPVHDAKPLTLAEFVQRTMREKNLSSYDIQRRGGIDQSYVNRIKNGHNTNPSIDRIRALAKGLGVSEDELVAVAQNRPPDGRRIANEKFAEMALKFDQLAPDGKERVQELIEFLDQAIDKRLKEQ